MKPELNPTEARQGRRVGVVHKVLIVSTVLAALGLGIVAVTYIV